MALFILPPTNLKLGGEKKHNSCYLVNRFGIAVVIFLGLPYPRDMESRSDKIGARRAEVARATWAVIAREGLDKASMRAIAQELGCSTGVLTHYFRDKEALLDFALNAISDQLRETVDAELASPPSLEHARAILVESLPTTAESRLWWTVWLSFTVAALTRERQGRNHAGLYQELRKHWQVLLARLRDAGSIAADIDPAVEVVSLLCMVDGIGVQALISPADFPAERQIAIITRYLERLAPKNA
jgi:AcrR family transcriptional regulator